MKSNKTPKRRRDIYVLSILIIGALPLTLIVALAVYLFVSYVFELLLAAF